MTINAYLEKIIERNPEQIITVYNSLHNIVYHGKADFAPLNLWDEYKNSHVENGIDIDGTPVTDLIINGDVSESVEEPAKKEPTMKSHYTHVPKEDVTACKELAKTMIKRKLAKHSFRLDEDDVTEIEYKVSSFFNAMQWEFRADFHDWIREEIHKAIANI